MGEGRLPSFRESAGLPGHRPSQLPSRSPVPLELFFFFFNYYLPQEQGAEFILYLFIYLSLDLGTSLLSVPARTLLVLICVVLSYSVVSNSLQPHGL